MNIAERAIALLCAVGVGVIAMFLSAFFALVSEDDLCNSTPKLVRWGGQVIIWGAYVAMLIWVF
jgi:hypothetical protein